LLDLHGLGFGQIVFPHNDDGQSSVMAGMRISAMRSLGNGFNRLDGSILVKTN
jgi:hypothetical protein